MWWIAAGLLLFLALDVIVKSGGGGKTASPLQTPLKQSSQPDRFLPTNSKHLAAASPIGRHFGLCRSVVSNTAPTPQRELPGLMRIWRSICILVRP
jgi:hypothetical protein